MAMAPTTTKEGIDYVGARLKDFWKVWEKYSMHPRIVSLLRNGYALSFKSRPKLVKSPNFLSRYQNPQKEEVLRKSVEEMIQKRAITYVEKAHSPGFYSRLFLVPKPGNKWRPVIDLSLLNHYLRICTFKMETAECIRQSLRQGEWVCSIDIKDAYFHVPIHPSSQKFLRFQTQKGIFQFLALPFGVATAPLEFTMIAKEVKLLASSMGIRMHQYLDDWLIRADSAEQCHTDTQKLISLVQELGWLVNFEKSELVPTQNLDFLGYHFSLTRALVFPTEKKLLKLHEKIVSIKKALFITARQLMSLIGTLACLEKTVPLGRLHLRPFQWHLKRFWKFPDSLEKTIPVTLDLRKHISWWESRQNLLRGSPLHPMESTLSIFTDASQKGWGAHLQQQSLSGLWTEQEQALHINLLEMKAVFLALKGFKETKRSKSASVFRQYVRRKLPEQTRWHKILSNGSSCMENNDISKCHGDPDKSETRPRQLECHSRLPVSQRQDHSVRMVVTPSNFSGNLSGMAHSHSRHVCHIKECKASSLCFSNTRYKCVAGRCSEHSMGKSRRVCFLPCSSHTPSDSKNDDLPVHNDCHSTGMAGDGMVLGLGGTVSKAPPQAAALAKHAETATQPHVSQKSRLSKPSRVVSPIRAKERRSRFSAKVEARIAAPQRKSSRAVYKSRWAIYEQWCLQNKMDSTKSSVSQIADFLLFLFEQKSLSPSTVSGYRTAIADRLGSGSDKISKSRDLNRLLASFHRDRPRIGKSIPTWDLSLVLLALTKKPFEPLNQAQLKFLTLKTVFLLALASGKRRSEIHAWTHASVFFRSDGSKVTVAPSSAFLAKNQLASDGPSSVQQVVIPALSSIVDSTLTQDISLCPVRALRIYLDRTQSIRKGKDLLFVSLKTGFTKDIARATISHWIKRTVQLCYQFADSETLQLSRVKAHDVRALAASLAFKGGVALDEILNSCYWRSHGTFTNFYLKDVCWENENVFKLGPLVAAQHIVSSM